MSLPVGWALARLDHLCKLLNGRAFGQAELLGMGKYPVLRVGNFFYSKKWYYSNLDLDLNKYCDAGDLLYAWSASFGPKIWEGPKVIYHYHIWKIDLYKDCVEKKFLYYWLLFDKDLLQHELGTGSTMIHVTKGSMEARGIALPPLAEQRRIVAKLDALNARLARARAEILKTMDVQRRLKGAICEAAISVTAEEQPLGTVLTDIRYGTAQKCGYKGATPVLRIPNVARGEINLSDLKSADFEPKDIAALSLAVGDVLIVRSNGSLDLVGRSAVVNEDAAGMLYAGYLIRLRLDPRKALPAYVQLWLSAPSTRAVIEKLARSSSGVNNINSKQLQALRVRLPDLETQEKRAGAAAAAFARADRLEAEAKKALALIDRLEAAILAKAFRGELVAQDPNDEPASVLLERIRARRAAEPKAKRGRRPKLAS